MNPPTRRADPPDDAFAHRLAATPPRELPPEWRTRILAHARARAAAPPAFSLFPLFASISRLLWPHPLAWGALAAAWLAIAALNFTGPRGEALYAVTPPGYEGRLPSAPEYLAHLEWQRQLFATLAAEPHPTYRLRPRDL